jgi:hypothetical protein
VSLGEFLFKMGYKFIFPIFFKKPVYATMWLNCPRVDG